MNNGFRTLLCACAGFFLFNPPVYAQVESNFAAGGGLRMGYSSTVCDSGIAGALRYNSAVTGSIDFCNGTSWLNAASGASIDELSDAATDYVTDHNLFMGLNAGRRILAGGQYNLFIGALAGDAATTGDNNLALGHSAYLRGTTGSGNIAIGRTALGAGNVAGSYVFTESIAIGHFAGYAMGNGSLAIGLFAVSGSAGAGGIDNVVIGYEAMRYKKGMQNVILGAGSLGSDGNNGNGNVAIGYWNLAGAAAHNTIQNIVVGSETGRHIKTGTNNILMGYRAGANLATADGNIIIGSSLSAPTATTNDYMSIGNLVYGDLTVNKYVGLHKAAPAYTLDVNGDVAFVGTTIDVSDRRKKDDIQVLPSQMAKLLALAPVSFVMTDDPDKNIEYGLIAQDVAKIYPALVKMADDADQSLSMNYAGLIAPMVRSVQERQLMLEAQQQRIDHLRGMLARKSARP